MPAGLGDPYERTKLSETATLFIRLQRKQLAKTIREYIVYVLTPIDGGYSWLNCQKYNLPNENHMCCSMPLIPVILAIALSVSASFPSSSNTRALFYIRQGVLRNYSADYENSLPSMETSQVDIE